MNLTWLSPTVFGLGLLGLAGGLYALQLLRVRHREQVVVTTLFWREEIQEQRARTLLERFRHPWTYVLCLLLAGLLWLGAARPDSDRSAGEQHVLLLDGSAATSPERFAAAKAALFAEVERRPRDRTEVLYCGASVRRLLAPGEERALLGERLAALEPAVEPAVEPAGAPESLTRALRAAGVRGGEQRIVIVGDGAPERAAVETLPESVSVTRAELAGAPAPGGGIELLGLAPAASGDWSLADALVAFRAPTSAGLSVAARVGDVALSTRLSDATPGAEATAGRREAWIQGVPLDGGTLEVQLFADGAPVGDVARVALPDRPRIAVALVGSDVVGDGLLALEAVLRADPAVTLVQDAAEADVVVGDVAAGEAGLALVPAALQEESILVGHGADVDSGAALALAVGELGLDRIDAGALAESVGRTISVGAAPAPARRVSLWTELLADDAGFTEARAFPLVVARAVRWIADAPEVPPYAAAGAPQPTRLDRAPAKAELARSASILDVGGAARASDLAPAAPSNPGPWRPTTWVLLAAALVLVLEWALHRKGRIA